MTHMLTQITAPADPSSLTVSHIGMQSHTTHADPPTQPPPSPTVQTHTPLTSGHKPDAQQCVS